jgi:hypothetical protein
VTNRRGIRAWAAAAAAALLLVPATARAAREHDSEPGNYILTIPETWDWLPVDPVLAKDGVVEIAQREIPDSGGYGGRMVLAVTDVKDFPDEYEDRLREWQMGEVEIARLSELEETPEIKAKLDALDEQAAKLREAMKAILSAFVAKSTGPAPKPVKPPAPPPPPPTPDVQRILLARFGPDVKVEVDAGTKLGVAGGSPVPAVEITATGTAGNLKGEQAPCKAVLFVVPLRKKLYRLAIWLWKLDKDKEHLESDLDQIEVAFQFQKTDALPKKIEPGKPNAGGIVEPTRPKDDTDSDKEVPTMNVAENWKVMKPKKLFTLPNDRAIKGNATIGVRYAAQSGPAYLTCDLYVYNNTSTDTADYDVEGGVRGRWAEFLKLHPRGDIQMGTWGPNAPFLSMPDVTKLKSVKNKRPPVLAKAGDPSMDPFRQGLVDELPGQVKIGAEKAKRLNRFFWKGARDRVGEEEVVEFNFSTTTHSFVFHIVFQKEALGLWKDDVDKLLKSFQLLAK